MNGEATPREGERSECAGYPGRPCPEPIIWTGRRWIHANPHNVRRAKAHYPHPAALDPSPPAEERKP